MKKTLIGLITLFLLTGCAARNLSDSYELEKGSTNGVLVGSVSHSQRIDNGHMEGVVFYNGPEEGKITSFEVLIPGTETYVTSVFTDSIGRIFVMELPEGEYTFYNWKVPHGMQYSGNVGGYYFSTGKSYFLPSPSLKPLKFSVKKGEITYIGNIHFQVGEGENEFGLSPNGYAQPIVKDKYDRDIGLFKERYINLSNSEIHKSLLPLGNWL